MSEPEPAPSIPFGYRQIRGQSQKGDGIWDSEAAKFRKVRREYPRTEASVIIRRCEVVQTEIPIAAASGDLEIGE